MKSLGVVPVTKEHRFRSVPSLVIVTLAVVTLAAGLGVISSKYLNRHREEEMVLGRDIRTQQILERMGTLRIGDTLPSFELQTSEGGIANLSSLVDQQTLIMFFDPGCGSCLEELKSVWALSRKDVSRSNFLVITSASPDLVDQAQRSLGTELSVLYDTADRYGTELGITTSPFHVLVDSTLHISKIIVGSMSDRELRDCLDD
jgi:peroxiredoxin